METVSKSDHEAALAKQKKEHDDAVAALKTEHGKEVKRLSDEAAASRVARNGALREGAAFRTILKAHNIDASSVTPESTRALAIEDGRVVDTFQYTAPAAPKPGEGGGGGNGNGGKPANTGDGITRESLAKMSPDEINRNWDKVREVMRASA